MSAILLIGLCHDMSINAGCGGYLSTAQALRERHTVHAVEIEHRGHSVPKCVGIDMREAVAFAKLFSQSVTLPGCMGFQLSCANKKPWSW